MATTYDYTTGKIERDFRFVRDGNKCRHSGLPCYVGSAWCNKCKHYDGSFRTLSYGSWTKCKHHEAEEEEDAPVYAYYDYIEKQAMCAL